MEERVRGTVQVSFGDVLLRAPETEDYLAVAAQILEMRRRELAAVSAVSVVAAPDAPERFQAAPPEVPAQAPVHEDRAGGPPLQAHAPAPVATVTAAVPAPAPAPAPSVTAAAPARRTRRPRWFHDRFPQVTLEDGSARTIASLEELRELLRSRGLQPHPRGDASMLLWQVRNRLNLGVEAVSAR